MPPRRSRLLPYGPWMFPAAVFLLTALAFLPAVGDGFVLWDDPKMLLENPHFRGLSPRHLLWMWTNLYFAHYMPLAWMSLGLDYVLWGANPVGYHLTSVLWHAAAAAAFFGLCRRLFALAFPGEGRRLEACAAFAALAWSLHPLRVECVAWVSQRRDGISALFYVLSLSAYLDGRRARSLGCFVLSLLGKEIGLTLPAVLVALDFFPLRRLPPDPRRWARPGLRALWLEKLPFLLAGAAAAAVGYAGELRLGAVVPLARFGIAQRLAESSFALLFYLWKTLWPSGLNFLYLEPADLNPRATVFLACQAGALVLLGAAWALRRRRPEVSVAAACYLAQLLPVVGLSKFGSHLAADRFAYLPGLSLAALLGGWLLAAPRAWGAAAAVLLAAWGALSWGQCRHWEDSESLWRRALASDPGNSVALHNLGILNAKRGRADRAGALLRQALELRPADLDNLENCGNALVLAGRPEEGAAVLRRALQIDPSRAETIAHLGMAVSRAGRPAEAEALYRRALGLKPDLGEAIYNLGVLLERRGRRVEAAARYAEALTADPGNADAANNLGLLRARAGRLPEALALYRRALAAGPLPPPDPEGFTPEGPKPPDRGAAARLHYNWGNALAELGRLPEAERHYRESLRLVPGTDTRFNLANALARQGRWGEAAQAYRAVLARDPAHRGAREYLRAVGRLSTP